MFDQRVRRRIRNPRNNEFGSGYQPNSHSRQGAKTRDTDTYILRCRQSKPRGKRMEYRQFGKTDLEVSAIGFGCWEIGGTYGRIDESQFVRAVWQAIDNGITCFDTAEAYGMGVSEEALARALGNRRHDVSIVTKFGVGYEELPTRRDSSRTRVIASIEKSLRRLRSDHVDVYLVHWPDPDTPFDETIRALDDIVRQGKARYIGVSNFRLAQIETCMRLRRIDVVQYGWNMFDRRMQAEIFPYCAAQQIGVMAYGSLAYGMLSGTFQAGMQFEESDWRSRGGMLGNLNLFRTLFGPEHFLHNLDAVEDLKRLAAKYDKTLPQFALRWTLSNPVVGTALVGFREPAEVSENLGALGWTIAAADMTEIDAILERHGCVTVPPGWLED
jgi:aryl-alcohol dehydrogenase-like predicted oxidoreductase